MVVCRCVVCPRDALWVDMYHGDHGKAVRVMEGVLHVMGGLVSFCHREVRIDSDCGGDVKQMTVPAELEVTDVKHTGHSCDDGFCRVDQLRVEVIVTIP